MSFIDSDKTFGTQPASLGPVFARIDRGQGRLEMYREHVPDVVARLAADARSTSVIASNAIAGIVAHHPRRPTRPLTGGEQRFRTDAERPLAGYAAALSELTSAAADEPVSVSLIVRTHRILMHHQPLHAGVLRSGVATAGHRNHGQAPWRAWETPEFLVDELVTRYHASVAREAAHPIILIAAFILDFLSIAPFEEANGRLSRLLTSYLLARHGYDVARYSSVEQRILETRDTYASSLRDSQEGWYEAEHSVWPWTAYLAGTIADVYDDFEQRAMTLRRLTTRSKQERVRLYILEDVGETFRISQIRRALPEVSDGTIRLALNALKQESRIELLTPGRDARWQRVNDRDDGP
jgi:Fic family protein